MSASALAQAHYHYSIRFSELWHHRQNNNNASSSFRFNRTLLLCTMSMYSSSSNVNTYLWWSPRRRRLRPCFWNEIMADLPPLLGSKKTTKCRNEKRKNFKFQSLPHRTGTQRQMTFRLQSFGTVEDNFYHQVYRKSIIFGRIIGLSTQTSNFSADSLRLRPIERSISGRNNPTNTFFRLIVESNLNPMRSASFLFKTLQERKRVPSLG